MVVALRQRPLGRVARSRKLTIGLGAVALADIAATWIWALAIDGEWGKQSQFATDVAYAGSGISAVLALAALLAALWNRSWRYVIGALIIATFAVVYAFASVAAIGLSRDPGGFGLM
jgi:hypothetical protein